MRYVFAFVTVLFFLSGRVAIADGIYTAELEYEKLVPRWPDSCNQNMGAPDTPSKPSADGLVEVCISNSCGWSEISLKQVNTVFGQRRSKELMYRAQIGEWCKPLIFPSQKSVLVDEHNGTMSFLPLYRTDKDELAIAPQPNGYVHGIPLSQITPTGRPAERVTVLLGAASEMTPEQLVSARSNPFLNERDGFFMFTRLITMADLKAAMAANNSLQRP